MKGRKKCRATCIPEGEYRLRLNSWAGMNARYGNRYGGLHKGMIKITGVPEFSLVFIHIGNYHTDTRGCPLVGSYWQLLDGDYRVLHSAAAYRFVYPCWWRRSSGGMIQWWSVKK